jgi:hypothetical protein
MTIDQRIVFERAAGRTYNAIGPDVWGREIPRPAEFVSVILDQMEAHSGLARTDLDAWFSLPFAEQRAIILTAL